MTVFGSLGDLLAINIQKNETIRSRNLKHVGGYETSRRSFDQSFVGDFSTRNMEAGSVSKPEIKEGAPTCKFRPACHNWMQQNAPKNLCNGASSRCAELSETVPECNNYSPVHEWDKENPPPSLVRLHNPPRAVRLRRSQIIIARNARNSD